jgi:hypothetical protein
MSFLCHGDPILFGRHVVDSLSARRGPHPARGTEACEGGGLGLPSSALFFCWSRAPIRESSEKLLVCYRIGLALKPSHHSAVEVVV